MAKFFRQISDFWNTIMEDMYRLISAFDTPGGDIFAKIKDLIASLLGKAADEAEAAEAEVE